MIVITRRRVVRNILVTTVKVALYPLLEIILQLNHILPREWGKGE